MVQLRGNPGLRHVPTETARGMETGEMEATPQDTYDHTIGTGALGYEWWHEIKHGPSVVAHWKADPNSTTVPDDWTAQLTADNGEGGEVTGDISHKIILDAARRIILKPPRFASEALIRECGNLLNAADDCDFDANSGDEFMQYIILGEIIYG